MNLNSIGICFLLLCWLFAFAFFSQRFVYQIRRRRGGGGGFYPTTGSLGNALQQLQTFAQPKIVHVLEEKQNERAEEDDAGGPEDPTNTREP